jgi:hypothetical protein
MTLPSGFVLPHVLVLLLVPVALLLWWRGSASRVALPFDGRSHRPRRWLRLLLALPHAAAPLALASAVVLLAGPTALHQPQSKRRLTNIQIVMDVSGSMSNEQPPRHVLARAALEQFTIARQKDGDAMGLIFFADWPVRWMPITQDLQAIRSSLEFCDPAKHDEDNKGTYIAAALEFAAKVMEAEAKEPAQGISDRVIVLVSDGDSQDIQDGDEARVAQPLIDAGVRLFYLHIGASSPPERTVSNVAAMTDGRAFEASDAEGMADVFQAIDLMTKAELDTIATQSIDSFRLPASFLLACCGLHLLGLLGLRYTPW